MCKWKPFEFSIVRQRHFHAANAGDMGRECSGDHEKRHDRRVNVTPPLMDGTNYQDKENDMNASTRSAGFCFLLSLTVMLGCNGAKDDFNKIKPGQNKVTEEAHHAHPEHGPHGGHLVELGEHEYHAEVVFDHEANALSVYLFGADLKKPLAIDGTEISLNLTIEDKPTQLTLAAAPLEGEPEGKSSRFALTGDPTVAEHVHDAEDLHGRLSVTIAGKPYSGAIEHHHGHDHGHDGDHGHDHADGHEHDGDHEHDHGEGHEHDDDHEHEKKADSK